MRVHFKLLIFAAFILFFTSCKKYNQVDNSGTVKTPYILYIGGYYGTLHKTNDALYFNTLFPTDHSTVRQVLAADTMLLYMKENFYFSRNEGISFKESNDHPRNFEDLFYKYYLPNQSLYDPIDKIVYLCSQTGLEKSSDNGVTFAQETNWDGGPPPTPPITPTSITRTVNGNLYMLKDSLDIYEKLVGGAWKKIPVVTSLPKDTPTWYISNQGNTLFAAEFSGKYGIVKSVDAGLNWTTCTGLAPKRKILFAKEALSLNNTFFVGQDSGGLYRLDATGSNFEPSGAGIPWYAKVHFVVGKKIVYRTDVERYYHFCATDVGLFISENDGRDWRLLRSGAYSTLF
ncbi:MAG TPA: hypothetical protein PLU17_01020 [Chitinophagaceae bacterium]|nr:hypothetical protein [Chitinophagaceae bacterium]